jgi:ABC-type nitrate/sulfonate/bicarbonate transport system substrate-binding protein
MLRAVTRRHFFRQAGFGIGDLELTFLNGPNTVTAFRNKVIDAALAVEPWPARFEEQGLAVRFRAPDQVQGLGPAQIAVIIYSGKFIAERRPVAQRWMTAYLKGCEFYASYGVTDPEVLAILEKYTKVYLSGCFPPTPAIVCWPCRPQHGRCRCRARPSRAPSSSSNVSSAPTTRAWNT